MQKQNWRLHAQEMRERHIRQNRRKWRLQVDQRGIHSRLNEEQENY